MNAFFSLLGLLLAFSPVQVQSIWGTSVGETLVVHAVSGEPTIEQDYEAAGTGATGPNGEAIRADDENDPVDPATHTYFPAQPYNDPKVTLYGLGGADEFLIRTYISGKPAIVAKHVNADGTIDWHGVAGENNNVHDHWVDYFGTVQINDFNKSQGDKLRVQGHTVALNSLEVVNGDTHITVQSQQGNGGGAHDEDILGYIIVKRVALTAADVTFTQTHDGITKTAPEFVTLVAYYDALAGTLKSGEKTVTRLSKPAQPAAASVAYVQPFPLWYSWFGAFPWWSLLVL